MTDTSPASAVPVVASGHDALEPAAQVAPLSSPMTGAIGAIWVRELRGRMRGKRAFIFMTVYLVLLAGLIYVGVRGVLDSFMFDALQQVSAGRGVFSAVVLIETLVVVALAPAYTAGSISQEREKQTFDLLAVTPVSSVAIVLGKLLSGLSYLFLIVGASIPLACLAFFFGGIGVETVVQAYLVLAVITTGVGSIGVATSAIFKRTQPATVAAFVATAAIVIGATAAWGVLTGRAQAEGGEPPPEALIYLNPFFAEADILCESANSVCIPGITMPADQAFGRAPVRPQFDEFGNPMPGVVTEEIPPPATSPMPGSLWPKSVLAWILLAGLMVAVASQAMSPSRRWRPGRRPTPAREPQA